VVLTLTGGILGSVLGTASSQVLAQLIDITPEITVTMFVLAGGISSAVGVIFGVYPALRAANLRPIEALRHE